MHLAKNDYFCRLSGNGKTLHNAKIIKQIKQNLICYIISVSKKRHINPYKEDVFVNQKYYKDSMARADVE